MKGVPPFFMQRTLSVASDRTVASSRENGRCVFRGASGPRTARRVRQRGHLLHSVLLAHLRSFVLQTCVRHARTRGRRRHSSPVVSHKAAPRFVCRVSPSLKTHEREPSGNPSCFVGTRRHRGKGKGRGVCRNTTREGHRSRRSLKSAGPRGGRLRELRETDGQLDRQAVFKIGGCLRPHRDLRRRRRNREMRMRLCLYRVFPWNVEGRMCGDLRTRESGCM